MCTMAIQAAAMAISAAGAIQQGNAQAKIAEANAKAAANQRRSEMAFAAVEESRVRQQMTRQTAQQRAQIASRGVTLDSPAALALGRDAARETFMAAGGVRANAQARGAELSLSEQIYAREASLARTRGTMSAAASVLEAAPEVWPGLMDGAP